MFSQFHGLRGIRNLAIVVGVMVFAVHCAGPCRRTPAAAGKPTVAPPLITLAPNEVQKIEVDTRKREVKYAFRKADGTVQTNVLEGVRKATVTQTVDGTVKVTARPWGFCFEPGLSLVAGDGIRPGLDVRFLYVRRFGVNVGVYYRPGIRLYLSSDYTLSRARLYNTSVWVGLNLQKEILFGLRVGF